MSHDPQRLLAELPVISDESVVEILDFLQAFILGFESFTVARFAATTTIDRAPISFGQNQRFRLTPLLFDAPQE
jgi:hypothetical protein